MESLGHEFESYGILGKILSFILLCEITMNYMVKWEDKVYQWHFWDKVYQWHFCAIGFKYKNELLVYRNTVQPALSETLLTGNSFNRCQYAFLFFFESGKAK